MAMQALRSGVSGGILKFFLLGLLLLAGGGLVFTDVGGFFRGGVGSNTVAKVADEDISTQRFDRTVRRTLPQLGITPQQAYQLGYTRELLNTEIRSRLLSKAAQDSGVLIDEKHVIDQLQTILAPAVQSGMSPQDALQTLLRNQNFTEAELTAAIRNEQTAALLVGALQGLSLAPSTATAKALYAFENETRDIRYIEFLDKDIKDIASPTPEQLAALYDKTRESYAIPETRTIDVITIKTDALKNAINISDEDLREAYDEAIESYETPETRTIAQAVLSTEEEAQKVFASAQKNNDLKTALETITGNASAFIPAKAMHENETLDELKAPVFTAEKPAILAPVQTPLGWSIIDLQAITPAATTPFETAKEDIKQDLLTDRLSEDIYALADEVDEFFAAGGTPQEAKTQFDLDIKTFENIDNFGLNPEQDETFRDTFGADINETITTAFDLEENETSAIFERETGDFVALHIQNITPKSYQPLESVKDSITQKWIADQQKADNAAKVKTLLTENTDTSLDAIAKGQGKTAKTLTGLTRDTEGKTPLTAESLSAVFKADQNMPVIMPIENGFAIAEITQVTLPQTTDDSALAEVKTKIARDQQNELMMIYINQLRGQYGAKINEDLLQRAYGTQEETY